MHFELQGYAAKSSVFLRVRCQQIIDRANVEIDDKIVRARKKLQDDWNKLSRIARFLQYICGNERPTDEQIASDKWIRNNCPDPDDTACYPYYIRHHKSEERAAMNQMLALCEQTDEPMVWISAEFAAILKLESTPATETKP